MAVRVRRQPGDKPGPDIVDSILSDPIAQRERGRQEINYNSTDRIIESGNLIGTTFIRPGALAQVTTAQGVFKAKVESFQMTVTSDPFDLTSAVQMERIK